MRLHIRHTTIYQYSEPVQLGPHVLRFRPRCDGSQILHRYRLELEPRPAMASEYLDAAGNTALGVWFDGATRELRIEVEMEVEPVRINPRDFLPDPSATELPISYAPSERAALGGYLGREFLPMVAALGEHLGSTSGRRTLDFLHALNAHAHGYYRGGIREQGGPQAPEQTIALGHGVCRDLAVLFVSCCRHAGIAARFVSGYQQGTSAGSDGTCTPGPRCTCPAVAGVATTPPTIWQSAPSMWRLPPRRIRPRPIPS